MHSRYLLLALPALALAKTDIAGCTSTAVVEHGGGRLIWYLPDTCEICEIPDCGGGRAPPKTNNPACPLVYTGTETYQPAFLPNCHGATTTSSHSEETTTATSTEEETEEPTITDPPVHEEEGHHGNDTTVTSTSTVHNNGTAQPTNGNPGNPGEDPDLSNAAGAALPTTFLAQGALAVAAVAAAFFL